MIRFLVITLILIQVQCLHAEASAKIKKIPQKSKPISVLILFSGDYKSKFQFDGLFQQEIAGVFVDSAGDSSDKDCELSAYFQKVIYAKAPHLKIDFRANCSVDQVKSKTILAPEYVRIKDLKTHSSSFYLSERHKNVQFKIVEFNN